MSRAKNGSSFFSGRLKSFKAILGFTLSPSTLDIIERQLENPYLLSHASLSYQLFVLLSYKLLRTESPEFYLPSFHELAEKITVNTQIPKKFEIVWHLSPPKKAEFSANNYNHSRRLRSASWRRGIPSVALIPHSTKELCSGNL